LTLCPGHEARQGQLGQERIESVLFIQQRSKPKRHKAMMIFILIVIVLELAVVIAGINELSKR